MSASLGEFTTGKSSYCIFISSAALCACTSLSATTTATGSPLYLTLSIAIGGLSTIVDPTSSEKNSPVITALTPEAFNTFLYSIDFIFA